MPDASPVRLAVTRCAICGYDLTGAASATCPECGYTPTPAEAALAERRAVFMELTRARAWMRFGVALFPFVLMSFHGRIGDVAMILGAISACSLAWGEVAGRLLIENVPRGQLALVRRVWRLSVVWLQLPFTAAGYALLGFILFDLVFRWSWSTWDRMTGWTTMALVIGGLGGLLAGLPCWKWSMRRLLRIGGATPDVAEVARYRQVAQWAMRPAAGLAALPVIFFSLWWLLDRLAPHWWR